MSKKRKEATEAASGQGGKDGSANEKNISKKVSLGGGGGGGTARGTAVSPLAASAPLNTLNYTEAGSVFVVGSGDCAQLGLGPDVFEKERPARISYFSTGNTLKEMDEEDENAAAPIHIVKVDAGGLHTLALSLEGKLYSWGCNDQKALGRSGEESEPAPVEGLDDVKIVDMACGDSHSLALSSTGQVYAWGTFRGTNGIFGFSADIECQPTPLLLASLKSITQITTGTNHILAMSAVDGKIYSWGIGEQDQLGRKIMGRRGVGASLIPRPINFRPKGRKNAKFVKAKCGGYHSFLVHSSNGIYSFGLNNYGQLGVGLTNSDGHDSSFPSLVVGIGEENEIVDVCGGEHFTVILDSLGQVWVCGRNDSGQLGLDATKYPELNPSPRKLSNLPPIKSISSGAAFTLAVSRDGDLWAWGYGEMGQLANESSDAPLPFQIDLKGRRVIMASGGGQHSVILVAPKE